MKTLKKEKKSRKPRKHSKQLKVPSNLKYLGSYFSISLEDDGEPITVNENKTEIEILSCNARLFGVNQKILFSAFNIPLSIVAFLRNVVLIFALQKPSSLHPSSKLLFGCLAITDLCVGLITQPLRVTYLMSPANSKLC